jgi:putative protease
MEFFVHGAICVCYSGQCYLSEKIAGRSANRGACIQACRSRYDLVDASGKVLVRDKALLSLKDYNLRGRLRELAEAGICSFKIEGRLKNESYVRNVVRDYSIALDRLVASQPENYERGSFGQVCGGFTPDTSKTFNRGYTELFLDGRRGKWAAMDSAKSMGELVGTVSGIGRGDITLKLNKGVSLNNGDGFSFVSRYGKVEGFRGDVCSGNTIRCKVSPALFAGVQLYRNINSAFEKEIERQGCTREIQVRVDLEFKRVDGIYTLEAVAVSEDGRRVAKTFEPSNQKADNQERMSDMLRKQIEKVSGIYRFYVGSVSGESELPFMSAAFLNGIRREIAEHLESIPCNKKDILLRVFGDKGRELLTQKNVSYKGNVSNHLSENVYLASGAENVEKAYELHHTEGAELMRSRYCIRHELGKCPKYHNCKDSGPLFLLNNGQRFALHFDCRNCEMTVTEA